MKELLFSITRDEFDITFFRGTGPGGQKRNKTSNACRVRHRESGAVGVSREGRSQVQNRSRAFVRCCQAEAFQKWLKVKTAEATVDREMLRKHVDEMLAPQYLKIEYYDPTS